MTVRLTMPRRLMVVLLCVSFVVVFITPTNEAWAAGNCARNGKPLADGTYKVSSPFGQRGSGFHRGIDLAGPEGTNIFAAMDGTVADAGPASGFGQWIVLDSQTPTGLVSTVYGHMYPDGVLVRKGQAVKQGTHIANIGNNGQSSGAHLHFEYWKGGRLSNGTAQDPAFIVNGSSSPNTIAVQQVSSTADCQTGNLKPGLVPPAFIAPLLDAGKICKGITPPLLAAQIEAESGFKTNANSPAAAKGPAQFIDSTWATWGRDGDKPPDGKKDVYDIEDAVRAQGEYMCSNYDLTAKGVANGSLQGDPVALAVAAYNAGFGAVQRNGGMPSGGQYTTETQPYVQKIMRRAQDFAAAPWTGGPATQVPSASNVDKQAIVDAAKQMLGKRWVWGGGSADGPTRDGFDSAGLVFYAVNKGTNGQVSLPRTADEQWFVGKEVALQEISPGDLVFSSWSQKGRPSHVGVAVGNGQMIHADRDKGVVVADFLPDSRARSVTS